MIPFWYLYPAAVIGSLIGVVVMALCITAARYDRQNILQPCIGCGKPTPSLTCNDCKKRLRKDLTYE